MDATGVRSTVSQRQARSNPALRFLKRCDYHEDVISSVTANV
jgi:hypothetical protein